MFKLKSVSGIEWYIYIEFLKLPKNECTRSLTTCWSINSFSGLKRRKVPHLWIGTDSNSIDVLWRFVSQPLSTRVSRDPSTTLGRDRVVTKFYLYSISINGKWYNLSFYLFLNFVFYVLVCKVIDNSTTCATGLLCHSKLKTFCCDTWLLFSFCLLKKFNSKIKC